MTVEVVLEAGVADEIERSRAELLGAGWELDDGYGQFVVALKPAAPGGEGAGGPRVRSGSAVGRACEVSGFVVVPGEWNIGVRCDTLGLHRRFGPFTVHGSECALRCVVDSGGALDVRLSGGGVVDLAGAQVACYVHDAAGERLGAFHVTDVAGDPATVRARMLPLAEVSVWPQIAMHRGRGYSQMAARPLVVTTRSTGPQRVDATLEEAVLLYFDHPSPAPLHLTLVDPATGARWRWWPLGAASRLQVAPGDWIVEVECGREPPRRVSVHATGVRTNVLITN